MDERKKRILKISMIVALIVLTIVAIVEACLLLSLNNKIADLQSENSQIEDQLENIQN